jgi:hypothetical protein
MTVIPVQSGANEIGKIELLDAMGRRVQVIYEGNFPIGEKNFFFDANHYAEGTYTVRISSNKRVEIHNLAIH